MLHNEPTAAGTAAVRGGRRCAKMGRVGGRVAARHNAQKKVVVTCCGGNTAAVLLWRGDAVGVAAVVVRSTRDRG